MSDNRAKDPSSGASWLQVVLVVVLVNLIGVGGFAYWVYWYPNVERGSPGKVVVVEIAKGASLKQVSSRLAEKQLIGARWIFRFYVRYLGLTRQLRAGTYYLPTPISPRALVAALVAGVPAKQATVTIPEGLTMLEIAQLIADAGIAPREQLLAEMSNNSLLEEIGVDGATLEGFLFPDTYRLALPTAARQVVERLFLRHQEVYTELETAMESPNGLDRGLGWLREELGWSQSEIVNLASIVEKETRAAAERPLIAGVFLNRLTRANFPSRRLQADPTVIYGCTAVSNPSAACKKFKGRLRRLQLNDPDNPYNTYQHAGLPPGPICNPGRAAIEAVMAARKTPFLYFVSKNDGTHEFSPSHAKHVQAVNRFQKRDRTAAP